MSTFEATTTLIDALDDTFLDTPSADHGSAAHPSSVRNAMDWLARSSSCES